MVLKILIAASGGNPYPLNLMNPLNLFLHNPSTQPAAGRRPQPSGRSPVKLKNPPAAGRSILRTFSFTTRLHNLLPAGGHNPRGAAPSTLTPKACPMPVALSFSVSMDYNKVVKFIRKMGKGACGTILPRAFSLICFIFPCSGRRLFFFLISRRIFYVQCGSTSCKRKMCRR